MTSPWSALDSATGSKNLYLNPDVIPAVNNAFEPYGVSLQTLINDRLDDTTGYFGTASNPLAVQLEQAFNSRGTTLTNYLQQQLSQTQDFVKTAQDAATALQAADDS
jgi:hypothetical protein